LANDIEAMMIELSNLKSVVTFTGKTLLQADKGEDQSDG
jgi:hypothetical protein